MSERRASSLGARLLDGSGWVSRPTEIEPSLEDEVTCDIVVVGGGLGGMLAALRLAEHGRDVVLLEADMCGWGASARNAGYITTTLGSDSRILKRFYADRVKALYRFATNSATFTEGLIDDQDIACGYRPTGFIQAATSAAMFRRIQENTKSTKRVTVGDAAELGIPRRFYGGVHVQAGGILNPGEFALGVRDLVRRSPVRVFERSAVRRLADTGGSVVAETDHGKVTAGQAVLTTNAFTGDLAIAPKRITTPVWVTAVETEPLTPEALDATGWTSRTPLITNHFVMQSFRTTDRNSIVVSTRRLETARHAKHDRLPNGAVVADLMRGLHERLPTLANVVPAQSWGGWIGMTPSMMSSVGHVTPRVLYSMACNGHGLPQAPYLGSLLGDYLAGKGMHPDLSAVWRTTPRFAPGVVNSAALWGGWFADRSLDRLDRLRTGRASA